MKVTTISVILITVYLLTTSLQCQKCNTGTLRLDNKSRTWLPAKNVSSQTFRDNANAIQTFEVTVIDTTEKAFNDCGENIFYEYKKATLYLNQTRTDSIHLSLASSSFICVSGWSNNNQDFSVCNVFGRLSAGEIVQSLPNLRLGNRIYLQALLILSNRGNTSNIDSLIIAKNVGIVGFKYGDKSYVLQ